MYEWMHDDICWCGSECDNTECERHLSNRISKTGIYTMAELKNTNYCPLKEKDNGKYNSQSAHDEG